MTVILKPVSGPACPQCGCQHSELVGQTKHWGQVLQQRRCRFCGRVFRAEPGQPPEPQGPIKEKPLAYPSLCCPSCNSSETFVTSTRRPIRHHQCRQCGRRFKSYENRESGRKP